MNREQKTYLNNWDNLVLNEGILWRRTVHKGNKVLQYVVPLEQRSDLMHQMHSSLFSGHLMFDKTIDKIRGRFFWPRMQKEVQEFIESCDECQRAQNPRIRPKGGLQPMLTNEPLELLTSDVLGPLKISKRGNIYILVVVDHKTKFIWLFSMKDQKAKTIANKLMKVICYFGLAQNLLTDQGKNFESDLIAELCELLDIRKIRTTPYHPECDGLSERLNRTIIKMIKTYINEDYDNWDDLLNGLAFAYNTSMHATTKFTPYELMFGRIPKLPIDLFIEKPIIEFPVTEGEYADKIKCNLRGAFDAVFTNTQSRMVLAKVYYDRVNVAAKFQPGDRVMVRDHKTEKGACKKFVNKWKGPYTVETVANEIDYTLKPDRPKGRRIIMHRNNLKKYVDRKSANFRPTEVGDEKESERKQKTKTAKRNEKAQENKKGAVRPRESKETRKLKRIKNGKIKKVVNKKKKNKIVKIKKINKVVKCKKVLSKVKNSKIKTTVGRIQPKRKCKNTT